VRRQKFPTSIGSSLISWALVYVVIKHQADRFVEADGVIFTTRYTAEIEVVFIGWMTRDKPITCIATEAYGVFTINDQESKCYTTATYACSRCTSQDAYQLYFINKDSARRGDEKQIQNYSTLGR